jgi:Asp-tRNA(Asn)/Glu-tRNA(Gln) amidotransferase A subunit family amidase
MFTAIPKGLIPAQPYTSFLVSDAAVKNKPLKGVRIGIVREFMVKHVKNDEAISDQIDKEIKAILRDKLGAELVESVDPLYPDDPTVPNMKYLFQQALAEVYSRHVPEYFTRKGPDDKLLYAVPGWDVTTVDYLVALGMGKAPLSPKINLRNISEGFGNPSTLLHMNEYLARRGDARVKDWASWVANATFKTDGEKARALNAAESKNPLPEPDTISYLKMQSANRLVLLRVMKENNIDVFVNPENTLPPFLLGNAAEPSADGRDSASCCQRFTALLGSPEIDVPAGFVNVSYDPKYVLSADQKRYTAVTGTVPTTLPHPMPISMMFWSGPGSDPDVIKAASAYEAATHHRTPPPSFGPVKQQRTSR